MNWYSYLRLSPLLGEALQGRGMQKGKAQAFPPRKPDSQSLTLSVLVEAVISEAERKETLHELHEHQGITGLLRVTLGGSHTKAVARSHWHCHCHTGSQSLTNVVTAPESHRLQQSPLNHRPMVTPYTRSCVGPTNTLLWHHTRNPSSNTRQKDTH